jgi:hypothetical protein
VERLGHGLVFLWWWPIFVVNFAGMNPAANSERSPQRPGIGLFLASSGAFHC